MSELPMKSPEISNVQHEKIISLFAHIDLTQEEDGELYHIFDNQDYEELLTVYGYNRLVVGIDEEKLLNLRLTHAPSDGFQHINTYVYDPERRILQVEEVTQNYSEELEEWRGQLYEIDLQSETLGSEKDSDYMRMMEGLRSVIKSSAEVAAIFEHYDKEELRISNEYEAEHNKDGWHTLELAALENEAALFDLMERVAKNSPSGARLLQSYRETSRLIALLDAQASPIRDKVQEMENRQVKIRQLHDSTEFVRLLSILNQVESDNKT